MTAKPMVSAITLTTGDGKTLDADLAINHDAVGGLVLCHPHPLYGGSRHDAVIGAVWDAALEAGLSAIRFDFRRDHDQGNAERHDVGAAIQVLAPSPVIIVGYSFGSYVGLRVDAPSVAGWVAIAPILHASEHAAGHDVRPTLLLSPRHDQYATPASVQGRTTTWKSTTFLELASADHFLAGHHREVAERAVEFARAALGNDVS